MQIGYMGGKTMLVLTRKQDEKITIMCPDGSLIGITVCRIEDNYKVRIGIDADKKYKITRTELIEKSNENYVDFFKKF
jgi:carbon storage regulator CsrA